MFTLLKFPYLICFFSAITKSHISQVKCKGVKDTAILIFNRILSTWAGCSHAKCKVNRFILSKVNPSSVKTLTEGHSHSVLKLSPKPEYVFNQMIHALRSERGYKNHVIYPHICQTPCRKIMRRGSYRHNLNPWLIFAES